MSEYFNNYLTYKVVRDRIIELEAELLKRIRLEKIEEANNKPKEDTK
jgi:hypothetical protein